ncbi:DUF1573 domain-containing protein [Flavobacterium columnare NBRC 100251 = ATCC 23463]|uniref:DUF1573 domain-containing protein n=2 Tax=Flavobacterium columnare TaxID=996 RepID=G8X7F8_FLACA|nr:DUF1573 domain-containing protein [Flavobacterium columnare]AEW84972.1 hypothetical protein FCOL_00585 [Flavobacterium columnare ATCC 49512]AMO19318.1 DUF1573 domain-containing protein [Flavobacterium columnare]AUX17256.1 hypothetical protein AQ623_02205 [Flavobacterium columnare]MBF6653698.1 DUF1573 domain-containing protein [Flavobacterium columnare]MBF6659262.1 DUF1573 domain-containing protein [Flavobacterium columnare]
MKKYSFAIFTILSLVACKSKDEFEVQQLDDNNLVLPQGVLSMKEESMKKKLKPGEYPKIEFDNLQHDFGTIKQGDKVEHIFKFTNTGKNDLYVMEVRPSCGCTAPEWTKTPVKKGQSGEIKIIFDSKGKSGQQTKSVALLTNTEQGNEILTFKANILVENNDSTTK